MPIIEMVIFSLTSAIIGCWGKSIVDYLGGLDYCTRRRVQFALCAEDIDDSIRVDESDFIRSVTQLCSNVVGDRESFQRDGDNGPCLDIGLPRSFHREGDCADEKQKTNDFIGSTSQMVSHFQVCCRRLCF